MVSPADKNGGNASADAVRTSRDGHSITWLSNAAYAGATGINAAAQYTGHRTAGGWQTTPFAPSRAEYPWVATGTATQPGGYAFSGGLSSMTIITGGDFDPADRDEIPGLGIPNADIYQVDGNGYATWISHGQGVVANSPFLKTTLAGVSEDGHTVFFESEEPMTPGVPNDGIARLYRWRAGIVESVGVDETGAILPLGSALGNGTTVVTGGGSGDSAQMPDSEAISADGSIFAYQDRPAPAIEFSSAPTAVYVHEDGVGSREISLSRRSGSLGQHASLAVLVAFTPELRQIYFQSPDQLTDDAPVGGGDYVYDRVSRELEFSNPDNSYAERTGAKSGIVRVSNDGSYVYFTSVDVLKPGAVAGERNLYVRHGDQTTLIGTLAAGDEGVNAVQLTGQANYPGRTSSSINESGTRLLFMSSAALRGAETAGLTQVYLYDAPSDGLKCVSCRPLGGPSQGEARFGMANGEPPLKPFSRAYTPRAISADGQAVAFSSTDQLVPADSNNTWDVYVYRDGRPWLLSSGTSQYASGFAGMSPDGSDIFMFTRDSLVAEDVDGGAQDVYDMRAGGGFLVSEPVPPCGGEACQPTPAGPPPSVGIGSTTVNGPPAANLRHQKKKHHRRHRTHHHKKKRGGKPHKKKCVGSKAHKKKCGGRARAKKHHGKAHAKKRQGARHGKQTNKIGRAGR